MTIDEGRDAVHDDLLELLNELADDWEYEGDITADTRFIADLGLESLDLVVLGTMLQERYGKLPFSEFLTEIGELPVDQRDVTTAELVAFITRNTTTGTTTTGTTGTTTTTISGGRP